MLGVDNWLKAPAERDIIARWTIGTEIRSGYDLALPPPPDPLRFVFLALGDTGDSDAAGPGESPQDAVGREIAAAAAPPVGHGDARLVVHTGDVVYMTGERRLYDRNFRRPYAAFVTPESTVDNLVFRLPFLPVPGNHDYYDLGNWMRWLARIPLLGAGMRAIIHELFAFNVPEGGSDMGRAYMQAFVHPPTDTGPDALLYLPGKQTRLPNRYYRFRFGIVDFFALDSNTLIAPSAVGAGEARADAARHEETLATQARALDRRLRHAQRALDRLRAEQRRQRAADPTQRSGLDTAAAGVSNAFRRLQTVLAAETQAPSECDHALQAVQLAVRHWDDTCEELTEAEEEEARENALQGLEEVSDEGCALLRTLEACLAVLPEGAVRSAILEARDGLDHALQGWAALVSPLPDDLRIQIRLLSERALDVQRELALERRRARFRPADHDAAQLHWLQEGLDRSMQERPDAWRVVYLHHPLYTSILNHCERADVQGVRENLVALLQDRVHLVLTGHSHAFEWFRSSLLPNTGLFVTGGGGQISLRRSLLEPRLWYRNRDDYAALRRSGAEECAVGGRGPNASDGESGSLYHYLCIEVTPDMLIVRPIGVRRLAYGYRREEPMPVYHAVELPDTRPPWQSRRLAAIVLRRDRPPQPEWG